MRPLYIGTEFGSPHPAIRMCAVAAIANIGAVMAFVKRIAEEHGSSLREVAAMNLAKLASSAERGTLSGSGDDR
jgi:hypothetical protein